MISKKIFLGTVDNFFKNRKALSIHQMETPFVQFNNYGLYNSKQVGYTITSSSNFYFNKDQKLEKIREDIQDSDVCIIDVTTVDSNKNLPLLVAKTYLICIEQNKKVILIHNKEKESYLKQITSRINPENLLGSFYMMGKPSQKMP